MAGGIVAGVLGMLAVPISKRVGLTGTVVASFVLVVAGLLGYRVRQRLARLR